MSGHLKAEIGYNKQNILEDRATSEGLGSSIIAGERFKGLSKKSQKVATNENDGEIYKTLLSNIIVEEAA